MIIIRKATVKDALLLSTLARDIYKEHYLHLWHPGGASWYMDEYAYAVDKTKKDLKEPFIEYYIADDEGFAAGYMKIVMNAALEGHETQPALEVERIYLFKKYMGKRIGGQMMQIALERASVLKKSIIFLKAMDSSTEAIAFYQKLGYAICSQLTLPLPAFALMKKEYRGMVILKKEVNV